MIKTGILFLLIVFLLTGSAYAQSFSEMNIPKLTSPFFLEAKSNISNVEIDYSQIPPIQKSFIIQFLPKITVKKTIPLPSITFKMIEFDDCLIDTSSSLSNFNCDLRNYRIFIPINMSIYAGTKSSPKNFIDIDGMRENEKWSLYYNSFINAPAQNEVYSRLLTQTRKYRDFYNLDDDEYLNFLSRFVQSIPYNDRDSTKFPIETLYEGNGDCEDKSMLLAGLLERENYDIVLVKFEAKNPKSPGHLVVGIRSAFSRNNDYSGYEAIDTTVYSYVGQYTNSPMYLSSYKSPPLVIKIGNGTKTYSKINETLFINKKISVCYAELNYVLTNEKSNDSRQNENHLKNICNLLEQQGLNEKQTYAWLSNENNPITLMEKDRANFFLYPSNPL